MNVRHPAVAGQFYPSDETKARMELEASFYSPLGPGDIPEVNKDGERTIVGAVVPHAGWMYSGPVAAHAYAAIARDGFPETFIIIGPNHQGVGAPVATTTHDFNTPFGVATIDHDIVQRLGNRVKDDPMPHRFEHSIEVQLPFLQYLTDDVKFVPISMTSQDLQTAAETAAEIRDAIADKDVVILASTDMSHYVTSEVARKKDHMVIDKILSMDAPGVYDEVSRHNISMCGYGPVMTMLMACGGSHAELLKYANSGDISPMREVVGYASILVKK
ncbi:MAG: AmmeMemoRadiSam system protein B [Euryarchaeota archaeon]|nr:AmmeMemoRadiSam system protein B [Euryarchaeota archaeon]